MTPKHPTATTEFPPLEAVTTPTLPTEQAAAYLLRRPQTLRGWACFENGPIKPVRIGTRLGWRTNDIRKLLNIGE